MIRSPPGKVARGGTSSMKLRFDIPCETRTLPNGLRVVVAPHPGVPIVTVDVTYDVGAGSNRRGRRVSHTSSST